MSENDNILNTRFIERIIVDLVEIKTTLKICAWIAGVSAPFLLGLGAILVSKVYETSTKIDQLTYRFVDGKIDRLTYRFDDVENRMDSLENRLKIVEEMLAKIDRKLDSKIEFKRQDAPN